MDLKDIIAIGGKPGLYRFVSQAKNGIIVEAMSDKKRFPAYSHDKISALEDIAIFTENDEVPLGKVFVAIFNRENGAAAMNHKSKPEEIKAYFNEILPEYDKDRVYVSDMKKVLMWYNILQELNLVDGEFSQEKEEDKKEEDGNEG